MATEEEGAFLFATRAYEMLTPGVKFRSGGLRLPVAAGTHLLPAHCHFSLTGPTPNSMSTSEPIPSPLSRPLHRLIHYGDRLNLDQRLGGVEGRDLDDCVGRIRRREVATPKLDDLRKVRHIPEEDRDLDDVREA